MDSNPYQSPETGSDYRPSNRSAIKQFLFWTIAIVGLPIAAISALCSTCFGIVAIAFGSASDAGVVILIALGLAAVAAGVGWAWWWAVKRLRD